MQLQLQISNIFSQGAEENRIRTVFPLFHFTPKIIPNAELDARSFSRSRGCDIHMNDQAVKVIRYKSTAGGHPRLFA